MKTRIVCREADRRDDIGQFSLAIASWCASPGHRRRPRPVGWAGRPPSRRTDRRATGGISRQSQFPASPDLDMIWGDLPPSLHRIVIRGRFEHTILQDGRGSGRPSGRRAIRPPGFAHRMAITRQFSVLSQGRARPAETTWKRTAGRALPYEHTTSARGRVEDAGGKGRSVALEDDPGHARIIRLDQARPGRGVGTSSPGPELGERHVTARFHPDFLVDEGVTPTDQGRLPPERQPERGLALVPDDPRGRPGTLPGSGRTHGDDVRMRSTGLHPSRDGRQDEARCRHQDQQRSEAQSRAKIPETRSDHASNVNPCR